MLPQTSLLISWLLTYRYAIVYPLAIAEGPVLMMVSGFLIHLGFFSFWPIYLITSAGDLTGDVVWYKIGEHGARTIIEKYGRFVSLTQENVERAEEFFKNHQTKILFISKITMGFGFALATLVAAGALKINFKKYMLINILGQFIWTGFLMAIGYFLGNLYTSIDKGFRWFFLGAAVVIVGAVGFGFSRYMKKRFGADTSKGGV